ncbi:MAG TPA: HAD-IA family hydrolase [Alphaproteobacteria bacterium]
MPLVLDIFGLVILQNGLNEPLLKLCANWRNQGEKIYGASNMSAIQNDKLWQMPGVRDAFDDIYCSGLLGVSKPDPVFYTAVTNKLHLQPEHILFFDDSGVNVEAARRMGWQAYAYSDEKDLSTIAEGFFAREHAHKRSEHAPQKADSGDIVLVDRGNENTSA